MKIVLDTNVLVSGLLTAKGNPARVLNLVLSGAVQTCFNSAIVSEYAEVLARPKFRLDPLRVSEVLAKLTSDGLRIDASSFAQLKLNLPDPDDEMFLGVALAVSADHLVTGNLVHFPGEMRRGCSVVTAAEFIAKWDARAQ
jgi:putative PIN family toxin of toxin-antitoxin system